MAGKELANAKVAAILCAQVYDLRTPLREIPNDIKLTHAHDLVGRLQFAIFANTTTTWIVFAGSNEPLDWYRHTLAIRKPIPSPPYPPNLDGMETHRGWTADAIEIIQTIRPHVDAACRAGREIILTGHSYGGPLAILTAYAIANCHETTSTTSIYTFGSPAPGNRAFAQACDAAIPNNHRFANPCDIVTKLPGGRYAHPGTHYPMPPRFPAHSIHRYLSDLGKLSV